MYASFISQSLKTFGSNKTGFNLMIYHFNIHGKMSRYNTMQITIKHSQLKLKFGVNISNAYFVRP